MQTIHPSSTEKLVRPSPKSTQSIFQVKQANPLKKLVYQEELHRMAHFDVDLEPYTTFRIGGDAQVLFIPHTEKELEQCMGFCRKYELVPKILGGGSNILIAQETIPLVISLRNFRELYFQDEQTIYAGAGVLLTGAVKMSIDKGLQGLEVLSGIPGTIGGAIAGNCGGKWEGKIVAIGDVVEQVKILTYDGEIQNLSKSSLEFGYRHSNLTNCIILGASLKLKPSSIEEVKERSRFLLQKKAESQPLSERSAGCVFKNPENIPAWKLIYDAGLSGKTIGGASVSKKHANFIINLGNAQASDVLKLIELIQREVQRFSGIDLHLEVKIW